jgi:diaminopimelate epimerase
MQIVNRSEIRLRVFERGVGETLSCGTGACAAVVAGIQSDLLDANVLVHTQGGDLTIAWQGGDTPVWMTGPATTVFQGEINLPNTL